jgi:threonyl-tRNA synthetase
MACLIEQYAGAFPVWLSPVQVNIIPIADRHMDYARELYQSLMDADIRAYIDDRSERMNLKIREAQLNKVPYMFIIGDKEISSSSVSVRLRTNEDLGIQGKDEIIRRIKGIIDSKDNLQL